MRNLYIFIYTSILLYSIGLTPQRQVYTYPHTLAKTTRHSVLLKNFRKDYVLEEAMKVPIPMDDSLNDSMVCLNLQ